MKNILAFSGGKDSTVMAMLEAEKGLEFEMIFTPTGNEPEELFVHIENISKTINRPLITLTNRTLDFWIKEFNALPNWRQRWCTRLLKIEPAKAHLLQNPNSTLFIGLRADEPERQGLYGEYATYRYPLREYGWTEKDVLTYLQKKGISIPGRRGGNCKLCFYQRIGEWYELWRDDPQSYAEGEKYEEMTNHTFRSHNNSLWPASLKELREKFEKGHAPKNANQLNLFGENETCRVCTL